MTRIYLMRHGPIVADFGPGDPPLSMFCTKESE
jgi:hypothetical protein